MKVGDVPDQTGDTPTVKVDVQLIMVIIERVIDWLHQQQRQRQRKQAFRDIRRIDAQLRMNDWNWSSYDPHYEEEKNAFFRTQKLLRQLRKEAFKKVRS